MILKCNCHQPFQDDKYGKGMRVHNVRHTDKEHEKYRCSNCGKERGEK